MEEQMALVFGICWHIHSFDEETQNLKWVGVHDVVL